MMIENNRRHLPSISWGAILAGCALSLVIYLGCSVLGTALGASFVQPLNTADPAGGLGIGALVGFGLATLVSVLVGALVAGRCAPALGGLHGLLSWAVGTLLSVFVLASAATGLAGTAFDVLGKAASAAGQGAAAAAPHVASQVERTLKAQGIDVDWNDLGQQLDTLLRQTGKPALNPDRLKAQAAGAGQDANRRAAQAAAQPQQATETAAQWLDHVRAAGRPALNAADKQALVNLIVARTGKPRPAAEKIADNYAQTYRQAMARYARLKAEAEHKARVAAAATASAVSKAAWVTLAVLLIGAAVGFGGGTLGYRGRPDADAPA